MTAPSVVARPAAPGGSPAPEPRQRRWPRRLLIGLNVFIAICLLAAGTLYAYISVRFGQIHRVSIGSLFHGNPNNPSEGGTAGSSDPLNILVVGSDTRTGLKSPDAAKFGSGAAVAGARSDTIMIVHLDPASSSASLISVPRDLWVPIPGKNESNRINTAFDSGPDLLVRAVQDNLGIPINHFVEVDFDTFRQSVEALGGVKFWYPEPVRDNDNGQNDSGLNITTPGCYNLTGEMALSLVRTRHLQYQDPNGRWIFEAESDLARIRRQQAFVKKVVHKAQSSGFADITKINGVVGAIVGNLTVDSGFSQSEMLRLTRRYRNFNPDQLSTVTLPTVPAVLPSGADVLFLQKDEARSVIDAWQGTHAPDASAAPPAAGPPTSLPEPSAVTVGVLNGTGRTREASLAVASLAAVGFNASVSGTGKADTFAYATTTIRYAPSDEAKARTLQSALSGASVLKADTSLTPGAVVLVTGTTYAGAHAPSTATSPSSSTTISPPAGAGAGAAPGGALPVFPGPRGQDPPPPGSGC